MKKANQTYGKKFSPDDHYEWRLRLKSSTDQITETIQRLDHCLDESKCCTDRQKNEILTALSEALANAIVHGNKNDPCKYVDLKIRKENQYLKITVKDEGQGFDPSAIPDPTKPENLQRQSGRGFYLMNIFMDDVKISKLKSGTRITMKKKLIYPDKK